jgi:hypothetical protein
MNSILRLVAPLTLGSLILVFSSCTNCIEGTGDSMEESRITKEYDAIEISGNMDVTIRQGLPGDENKVIVTAQSNLIPLITTKVNGKKLIIETQECVSPTDDLSIQVFSNGVTRISSSGSGEVQSANTLVSDELSIEKSGSGDMMIRFEGERIDIEQSGSGDVKVLGTVNDVDIDGSGSGSVNALELQANNAEVNNSGSGSVSVVAAKSLKVDNSGSGDVEYKGNPQDINQSNSGSGEVKRR